MREFGNFVATNSMGFSNTVCIPKVYEKYSTKRVLVMEELDGISLSDYLDEKNKGEITSEIYSPPFQKPNHFHLLWHIEEILIIMMQRCRSCLHSTKQAVML